MRPVTAAYKAAPRSALTVSEFRGVDLYNAPTNVAPSRSPDAPNMIRDVPGKVRKRMGFHTIAQYGGRINGVFAYVRDGKRTELIHAGTQLVAGETTLADGSPLPAAVGTAGEAAAENLTEAAPQTDELHGAVAVPDAVTSAEAASPAESAVESSSTSASTPTSNTPYTPPAPGTVLCTALRDARSKGWQLGDALYLLDGATFRSWDGTTAVPVSERAYVPRLTISRAPGGGGTAYEQLNLLGSRWSEEFLADGTAAVYQLSFDDLDADFIKVELKTAADTWVEKTRDADYSFNAALGQVTFVTAPPESAVPGADSVRITAQKTRPDAVARINRCDMAVLYGVGGAADRLFVTGNPDYPSYDWYSAMNDATYFPQNAYSVLGLDSRVVGYSIIEDKLAAHKAGDADGRNLILRAGELTDGKAAFPIRGALHGEGAVSGHAIAYLKTEPLFFTRGGVCAVTPADTNGERYAQNRSFFVNSVLESLPDKAESCAVSYRDFYVLAHGDRLYVLDSLLKSYEAGAPYSTHQYEAFVLTGIGARVLWTHGSALRFGRADGAVCEFYTDPADPQSYSDDGAPIAAHWDTPVVSTDAFYHKKRFRYLALKLLAAPVTGVEASVQLGGVWQPLFAESARLRYWSFERLCFSKLNFSADTTPRAFGRKLRLPGTDKARFRFANGAANEPFGLHNFALEFTRSGVLK